jgi:quercetin dioxygenase-like cupin family protein
MLVAPGASVPQIAVTAIEGAPVTGGAILVRPMLKGSEMTVLEIFYGKGVASSPHKHAHESMIYVVKGRLKGVIDGVPCELAAGDSCRHPAGVMHSVEALEDSLIVEVKSPAPDIAHFFATA